MASKPIKVPGSPEEQSQPIAQSPQPMPADLPNAIDVDPLKITAPVLTRQGWICPPDKQHAR